MRIGYAAYVAVGAAILFGIRIVGEYLCPTSETARWIWEGALVSTGIHLIPILLLVWLMRDVRIGDNQNAPVVQWPLGVSEMGITIVSISIAAIAARDYTAAALSEDNAPELAILPLGLIYGGVGGTLALVYHFRKPKGGAKVLGLLNARVTSLAIIASALAAIMTNVSCGRSQ